MTAAPRHDPLAAAPAPAAGRLRTLAPGLSVAALAALGGLLYGRLQPLADAVVAGLPLAPGTRLAEAVRFFAYEVPKVLLLLAAVVFAMGVVRSYFSPERTRALLAGRRAGVGNALAAALGVVTPFCSCSAVPLFIGFLGAGVPLGVTLSFLIAAPMINEIALGLLFALFGWRVAALYLALGLAVALSAGWIIGRLDLETWVEDWVRTRPHTVVAVTGDGDIGWNARLVAGRDAVRDIVGRVWPYLLAGIAVGAGIHGYVPTDFMAGIMGREAWWSVPLAVALGVPMYSNAAGIVPVVEALLAKGAAFGTVLAFMMSVVALSLPELVILRKVLKPRLIAVFFGVVATGILLVGYVFNLVL